MKHLPLTLPFTIQTDHKAMSIKCIECEGIAKVSATTRFN